MLFNSPEFLFAFLPLTLVGFYLLAKLRAELAIGFLVAASLFFYGWWNPAYLALLGFSMTFNYAVGRVLVRRSRSAPGAGRLTLIGGVAVNLGLLGYFKYYDFFVSSASHVLGLDWASANIILPLAISFFTFQQITYLVDAHRGLAGEYNPLHYALFVTFFPQLIAGPIVHHSEMMPQFARRETFRYQHRNLAIGGSMLVIGLFKKVVIADGVARYSTPVFDAANAGVTLTFFEAWGGALAYTFQLYFDFSGYSDMAIGLARLFGIRLPVNFSSPYKACDIADFWRRWHMTLSRFLRDYLYIPLGGGRTGAVRRNANLMTTMLLGGLWHGAGWTFVVWGGLHGLFLVLNRLWRSCGEHVPGLRLPRSVAWALTFVVVVVAWVPFRAESFAATEQMFAAMAGLNGVALPPALASSLGPLGALLVELGVRVDAGVEHLWGLRQIAALAVLLVVVVTMPSSQELLERYRPVFARPAGPRTRRWLVWRPSAGVAVLLAAGCVVALLSLGEVSEFLYFQF